MGILRYPRKGEEERIDLLELCLVFEGISFTKRQSLTCCFGLRVMFLGYTYIGYSGLHVLVFAIFSCFYQGWVSHGGLILYPLSLLSFGCLSCLVSLGRSRCIVSPFLHCTARG